MLRQTRFDVLGRAPFSRVGCCARMWLQISYSLDIAFCTVYALWAWGLCWGGGALLRRFVIGNMKFLAFLDLS